MLPFELVNVYDIKYTGKIGKKVSNSMNDTNFDINNDMVIKDILKLDWNDNFDTLILGHSDELLKNMTSGFKDELISKCIKYNKKIYSFDEINTDILDEYKEKDLPSMYYPFVDKFSIPCLQFGKMRKIKTPIIGVFGTSSKQGKFTLQLQLRKYFMEQGYKVGQIGTEPSSLLFGIDEVYLMGYNHNLNVTKQQEVQVLNSMISRIEDKGVDLIIVGSQSITIPYECSNINLIPIYQYGFILGTMPDAVVLCVNLIDDIDYIERTIKYIEGLGNSKVMALVIFPVISIGEFGQKSIADIKYQRECSSRLENRFKIKTYLLDEVEEIYRLSQELIEYFSE